MKKFLIISLPVLLVFSFFLFLDLTLAADPPIIPPPEEEEEEECEPSMSTWTEEEYDVDEFKCGDEPCETNILKRERWKVYDCWDDGCDDSGCDFAGYIYTDPEPSGYKCESWQVCKNGDWSEEIPECKCEGECLKAPENPRYYDNPTYPTNPDDPEKDMGNTEVKLPVKLDWDDIEGWGKDDGPQSYIIDLKIKEVAPSVLDKSEYNVQENNGSCFLNSTSSYDWTAKACCSANGDNCGLESDIWNFTTNLAPEPYYPLDPDWSGLKKIENLGKEESTKLNWCEMEDSTLYEETLVEGEKVYRPLSYKILIYYLDKDSCHPQLTFRGECFPKVLAPDKNVFSKEKLPPDEFIDEGLFFTKKATYFWKVAACKDDHGQECSDYSQLWGFSTGNWDLEVILVNPPNDAETPIGLPVILTWDSAGANSYNYELKGVESGKNETANVLFDYPKILPDTVYEWTVQSCNDYESKECEDTWAGPWQFKTTGEPPNLIYPVGNNTPIPISFEWQKVPGTKSYVFKIQGGGLHKEITTGENEQSVSLNYPDLKQETNYTWQVKTCAKSKGSVCGEWSNPPQQVKTLKLKPPQLFSPQNNESFFTYQKNYIIDWEKTAGGNFYEYEVNFVNVSPEETNKACKPENILPQTITGETNSASLKLVCLGGYQWKIRSCLDENCQEASNWSSQYNFSFVQKEESTGTGGLVPCGRTEDNPDTTWNEREDCEIKHIFLLIRNIIDFVLWTVAPLLLALLVVASGAMFYLSIKFQDNLFLTRIKLIWKAAGMGYGVIFLSWMALNLFLSLIGFKIGIFGNWWQVGF